MPSPPAKPLASSSTGVASTIHRVIVGTAGHIDHGKSSLVRYLTGIDPDRLSEEKARGMTIDLGFAPYHTAAGGTVGLIDVPGHERFIKNMVAGASSVDIFMLVVAADDGVMPQTREHVEILDLLGARCGLVAVTKIDLVDPELRELAIEDIREYLTGTPFEGAPLLPISTQTGEGMDTLKEELERLIGSTPARATDGLFRMPIQRVFSAKGHGTVVTGVPMSGHVEVGELVEVLPAGLRGKVRSIQAYKEDRGVADAGHSTAMNLSDIDYREVTRGMVVAKPGFFHPTQLVEAKLRYLASASRPLAHGEDVRLHVGTGEVIARVILLESSELEPGAETLIQLRLREPVVVGPGDRFLIRQPTPMVTLGGGMLVSTSEVRITRNRTAAVESVRQKASAIDDMSTFLERSLFDRGMKPTARRDAAVILKASPERAEEVLKELIDGGRVHPIGRDRVLHGDMLGAACDAVMKSLRAFHMDHPLRTHAELLKVRQDTRLADAVLEAAIDRLSTAGEVVAGKGGRVRMAAHQPALTPEMERLRGKIVAELESAGLQPPSVEEMTPRLAAREGDVAALVQLLVDEGVVVRAGEMNFAASAIDRAIAEVRRVAAAHQGEVLFPEVRDGLGTSRKYLIPLMELLDSRGITARRGEKRYLVETTR